MRSTRGDPDALRGEIGDLMFEGVFLAQICADAGRLHRRRFAERDHRKADPAPPARVRSQRSAARDRQVKSSSNGKQIKAKEQVDAGARRSVLAACPRSLPALLRAHEIGTRVAAVGFDWPRAADVVDKIEEEVAELRRAVDGEGLTRTEEEMGDLLFAIANLVPQARHRARVGAPDGEREVHETLHRPRNDAFTTPDDRCSRCRSKSWRGSGVAVKAD